MDSSPAPETAPTPEANEREGDRWRRISWVALCIVLFVPLWLVSGILSFLGLGLADHLLRAYHLSAIVPSTVVTELGVFVITAWLTVFVARRGLKRGWNSARGLRWGWSLTSALVIFLTTGSFLLYRRAGHSTVDKVVTGQARQLSVAADEYFLVNGVSTVSYDSLVGPTNYVKAVFPVHQEIYPAYYTQGITITVKNVEGVRTVTYAP